MSLYGGISFDKIKSDADLTSASPPTPSVSSKESTPVTPPVVASVPAVTSNWSSQLKFNPVIRKIKRPPATSVPLAFRNSHVDDVVESGSSRTRIVGPAKSSPFLIDSNSASTSSSKIPPPPATISSPASVLPPPRISSFVPAPPQQSRVLPKAPPMTLEEDDIDGSAHTSSKGKGKQGNSNGRFVGQGRGKKGGNREDPALAYTDVAYDPSRPCDYAAYKLHVKAVRTRKRIEREEELKRNRHSSSGSSYTGSSDEDEGRDQVDDQAAQKKARFAPPASYDNDSHSSATPSVVAATLMNPEESGEAAYLRRLAMSTATTITHASPTTTLPPPVVNQPRPPPSFFPTSASTASSSGSASTYSAPSTTFVPPTFAPSKLPPPPPPAFFTPPVYAGPVLPSAAAPPISSAPTATPNIVLSEAAAKARDIALRFSKLAALQPPAPVSISVEQDDRPFAQRMMASYGWKEGQGLGADASGRLDALSVARPLSSKNYKGKKKDEMIDTSVVTGMAKGRSAIIDSSRESRLADEAQRYGSASRVVVLTNLCAANEVDDDLGGEVAGEANKFGVVERAMVYLVPGDVRDEEAVRIFLVMSGLAGGWNSVKSFDGRHFGGRVVKARFYDEGAFTRGNYHL